MNSLTSSAQLHPPRWADALAVFLVAVFLISGILTLPFYGLTWDEGLGNLNFGERYLHYFMTFQEKYLDFKADLTALERPMNLNRSWMVDHPQEFPALPDVVSAASMELLSFRLGWMDPVDAFHLPKVLLASILLWALYRFTARRFGVVAGLAALAFLGTFPRFWGDMHFNPKDIPETVLFALAIFAMWRWVEQPTWKRAALSGLAWGAAVAIKANGIFIPLILAAAVFSMLLQPRVWRVAVKKWPLYAVQIVSMLCVALVFYVLSWPYLYVNNTPYNGLTNYWSYILDQGARIPVRVWKLLPLRLVITTMPEWMLIFVVLGIGLAVVQFFRTRKPVYVLLLAWLVLPIARSSMPKAVDNFDGIRHFLEFIPAAAILAGLAAGWLVERARAFRPAFGILATVVIVVGIVANTIFNFASFGRYHHLYFNTLIGGFPGAAQTYGEGEDSDYWGGSFRQAMAWLNEHAPANSYVQAPVAPWLIELTAPIWLRPDIRFPSGKIFYKLIANGEPIYLIVLKDPSETPAWSAEVIKGRPPVHIIDLQGVPLVNIYQISP